MGILGVDDLVVVGIIAALSWGEGLDALFNNPENQAICVGACVGENLATNPWCKSLEVLGFVPQQDWLPIKQPNVIN
jgi:hypothetical protein